MRDGICDHPSRFAGSTNQTCEPPAGSQPDMRSEAERVERNSQETRAYIAELEKPAASHLNKINAAIQIAFWHWSADERGDLIDYLDSLLADRKQLHELRERHKFLGIDRFQVVAKKLGALPGELCSAVIEREVEKLLADRKRLEYFERNPYCVYYLHGVWFSQPSGRACKGLCDAIDAAMREDLT